MYGTGLAKGLMLTLRHFVDSYIDDIRYGFRKYSHSVDNFGIRQGTQTKGVITVQYPDEKVAVPERFRFVPFLIVEDEDHPTRAGKDWCTSCGICAKVCPPQCIWIVRGNDPDTGRPVPEPEAFFIDIDICMNCGYCAEYCPFDAIKMDHDYELASYDRTTHHIHDKERLSKPNSYWRSIAPTRAYEEMLARGTWEHKDAAKEARRGQSASRSSAPRPAAKAAPAPAEKEEAQATPEPAVSAAPAAAADGATPWSEDDAKREERRRKALERKARRAAKSGG
ncbi:MAG: 4Fe-4S binding protein [Chloroflexi bacterium]|nr:4Fe-4S binding protein [Chloroflexota bacterium]